MYEDPSIFTSSSIIDMLLSSNSSECGLCAGFKNRSSSGNSTPNDLVIAALFGTQKYNFVAFVRNLRSVGCKCSILFFVDTEFYDNLKENERSIIEACGTVLIKYKFKEKRPDMRTFKLLPIQIFLDQYYHLFDRVLACDVFDSYFQIDPFMAGLSYDKIFLSIERIKFRNNSINKFWLRTLDDNYKAKFYRDKFVINAGILVGKSDVFLDLLRAMSKPEFLNKSHLAPLDQAILNYLVYNGIFTKVEVDFAGKYCVSAALSIFERDADENQCFHELWHHDVTPAIIHMFDRICPIRMAYYETCPPIKGMKIDYNRKRQFTQACTSYYYSTAAVDYINDSFNASL